MNVIIVCHTEFGLVKNQTVIADKRATDGVSKGCLNLIKLADKYKAKLTFALMPETLKLFPNQGNHEIGLHVHPGWQKFCIEGIEFNMGDKYLIENCEQSSKSSILRDYNFKEQLDMIKTGNDYIEDFLKIKPTSFVAGRWSINNDTIKALIKTGFTRDCSATPYHKIIHFDWSELPRICMPYSPDERNYQFKGKLPILIIPISQIFPRGNVNPEIAPFVGSSWIKASFLEYCSYNMPLFHICLHSPSMTDPFFISVMDDLLHFISKKPSAKFSFASEIEADYKEAPFLNISPYLLSINKNIICFSLKTVYQKLAIIH